MFIFREVSLKLLAANPKVTLRGDRTETAYPRILSKSDFSEYILGFPGGTSGKEPVCKCRRPKRCGFNPRVRKIPWRRAWQCTP